MTTDRIIRVGHRPDPDDACMFYDLSSDNVKLNGIILEYLLEDIRFRLGDERGLIPPMDDIRLF